MTCWGMLPIISSIYDSLGFVAPYTLKGKKLLQQLCQDEVSYLGEIAYLGETHVMLPWRILVYNIVCIIRLNFQFSTQKKVEQNLAVLVPTL